MALWKLHAVGDRINLTYFETVRRGGKPPQPRGEVELPGEQELAAWVLGELAEWD
jgi:hypothetical protein